MVTGVPAHLSRAARRARHLYRPGIPVQGVLGVFNSVNRSIVRSIPEEVASAVARFYMIRRKHQT
jgi:hypothetical protein